ncbi:hypothetical protein DM02DRAFT_641937 [Periconia macrospinosa]|uniref:Fe2OG dioxygenase domain-containing protein n=1 Tax=Periconia macrospinosa TaxID=97972 RepID=A0A2V1DSU5_9PLEO|nr:hypothetical protein DM02DRAFT_641937 [Periconia macrospinosa]
MSSTTRRSNPGHSWSISTIVQYVFITVVGYVLAGAPLQTLLFSSASTSSAQNGEKLEGLVVPDRNLTCGGHGFKGVYVLNRDPLVVYIEGFLSQEECDHVVDVSNPLFKPSTIWTGGQERLDPTVRLSEKARVPRSQTVQCIEERARTFQGWRPFVFIEKLWAQKYGPGGHYSYHYDWGHAVKGSGRISSFMVWLGDECEGGGTRFPRLERPIEEGWCRFIECGEEGVKSGGHAGKEGAIDVDDENEQEEEEEGMGITFKPIRGNAVFWENMREDGTAFGESWHAGLPVTKGTKIGLNIWSWYQEGFDPYAEDPIAESL